MICSRRGDWCLWSTRNAVRTETPIAQTRAAGRSIRNPIGQGEVLANFLKISVSRHLEHLQGGGEFLDCLTKFIVFSLDRKKKKKNALELMRCNMMRKQRTLPRKATPPYFLTRRMTEYRLDSVAELIYLIFRS